MTYSTVPHWRALHSWNVWHGIGSTRGTELSEFTFPISPHMSETLFYLHQVRPEGSKEQMHNWLKHFIMKLKYLQMDKTSFSEFFSN